MYKIVAGDYIVHQSNTIDKDFLALSAKLEHSLNKSGTLNFTVPASNYAYSNHALQKLKVPVYIYYNDKEIWRGRILDTAQDFYNKMTFKCEGWLSVLCDSIVRPEDNITVKITGTNVMELFSALIDNHNAQVETEKQFTVHYVGFVDEEDQEADDQPVVKSIHVLALECINGDWGNGDERKQRLTAAGYDYEAIQTEVNRIIWSGEDYDAEYAALHSGNDVEEDNVEDALVGDAEEDESETSSDMPSANDIITMAESYLGAEGVSTDSRYMEILDIYNSYTPLPRNYAMEVGDPWCDAFLSAVFIKCGGISLLGGPECYVDSHIANFKTVSIWTDDTSRTPDPGDIIAFNWNGDGETDHIGIVVEVNGTTIKTIEGNSSNTVAYQTYTVGDSVIQGYAIPKYGSGSGSGSSDTDSRSYYSTLDYIMEKFINDEEIGGTIWCEGNQLYYYAKDHYRTLDNTQTIYFGTNMLDFNNYVDASEVYTCLIPVGKDGLLINGKHSSSTGDATLYGIDISHHNEPFDWTQAKNDLDVVITSVTQIGNALNPYFEQAYTGCTTNDILIGAYKYSYALSGEASRVEAQAVVSVLNGRSLDFPIFLDLEDESQEWLGDATILSIIEEFESVVTGAGYKFGIYCNKYWYETIIPESCRTKYDFWIASVPNDDDGTLQERVKPSYENCTLVGWQYSFNGSFSWGGTTSAFDLDVFYTDYSGSSSGSATTADDYLESETGIELFGRIFRAIEYSDIDTVAKLKEKGQEALDKAIEEATTIEISAFDLSLIDVDYSAITLGTKHQIISKPHGIEEEFVCSSMNLDLCNPANNTYTFGVQPKTLTSKYNSLYSSVYNRSSTVNNYIITQQEADTSKTNIKYTIVGKRVEFQSISFYKYGSEVYLDFTAKFLKKVNNASAIMKFDTKYAPSYQSFGTAFNETDSSSFTIKASSDAQVVVNCNGYVARNSIVSGTVRWQV